MSFKFFKGKTDSYLQLEPMQMLTLSRASYYPQNVEFCFQFGDSEPTVFATGPNECTIRLSPTPDGIVTFTSNEGSTFKLFAREAING
jgi:hypothetical protein